MSQKCICLILCGVILLLGIAGCFWITRPAENNTVAVIQDGVILHTFDLSDTEDTVFQVESPYGVNEIQVQDGTIRTLSADCPDQTCVRMGALSPTGLPIVCLPHRLVIQYTEHTETDVVTG
ncbi:MAG: NusG domain II-containing protein [Peptococcaceae bacterium]